MPNFLLALFWDFSDEKKIAILLPGTLSMEMEIISIQ